VKKAGQVSFSIPEPCHVPWEGMTTVNDIHRHCASCEKTVVDFSRMSDDELLLYLRHNSGSTCGRFAKHQLNRPMQLLPGRSAPAKWWKTLLLLPLTLFSKDARAQYFEVANEDRMPDTASIAVRDSNVTAVEESIVAVDSLLPVRDSGSIVSIDPNEICEPDSEVIVAPVVVSLNPGLISTGTYFIPEHDIIYGGFGTQPEIIGFVNPINEEAWETQRIRQGFDILKPYDPEDPQKPASPNSPASTDFSAILPKRQRWFRRS
jgi:hypothetical protein